MPNTDRIVSIDAHGRARCINAGTAVEIPFLFGDALECKRLFGVVPMPVTKAILRNIEPAHAAIDMAIRCSPAKTQEAN